MTVRTMRKPQRENKKLKLKKNYIYVFAGPAFSRKMHSILLFTHVGERCYKIHRT